jgi:hypothetical protein
MQLCCAQSRDIIIVTSRRLVCPSGVIASYLHASSGPGLGKMGALVALADSKGALQGEAACKVKVRPPNCPPSINAL